MTEVVETTQIVGFRDPEQTFAVFRLAFRENLPDLEYRCLSGGFKARERISPLGYAEFRDELLAKTPFLRLALHKAKIDEIQHLGERRTRIRASALGRTLVVDFVREEYWEIWAGRELLLDDGVGDLYEEGYVAVVLDESGSQWYLGQVPLEGIDDPKQITEVRLGKEWKIDAFVVED
jgi:hypothetical protein